VGDIRQDVQAIVNSGNVDALVKLGLVKKGKDGNYEINEAGYKRLLSGQKFNQKRFAKSDFYAKNVTKRYDGAKALQGIQKSPSYEWSYKAGKGPKGKFTGPMAQDVNKNLGNMAAPGGKKIDLVTMNGMNMSAIGYLGDRVDGMQYTLNHMLQGIYINTGRMAQRLDSIGGLMITLPGVDLKRAKDFMKGSGDRLKAAIEKGSQRLSDKIGSYQRNPDGTLKTSLINAGSSMGALIAQTFEQAKDRLISGASKVNKNYIQPGKDKAVDYYKNNKDSVKNSLLNVFNRGVELVNTTYNKASEIFSDFVSNKLPEGYRQLVAASIFAKNKLLDKLKQPNDVYVKGRSTPALLALLMKGHYYFDQASGDLIRCPGDIKGPVIDKDGNVALSMDDIRSGICDNQGKPFKSLMETLKDKAFELGSKAVEKVKTGIEIAKQFGQGMFSKWKSKSSSSDGMGGSSVIKLLTEIRDILKNQARPMGPSTGPNSRTISGFLASQEPQYNNAQTSLSGIMDGAVNAGSMAIDGVKGLGKLGFVQKGLDRIKGSGWFGKAAGLFGRAKGTNLGGKVSELSALAKDKFNMVKDRYGEYKQQRDNGKGDVNAPKQIYRNVTQGSGQPSHQFADKGKRVGNWEDQLATRQANADQRRAQQQQTIEALQANNQAKYTSSENVIDAMIGKLSGARDTISAGLDAISDVMDIGGGGGNAKKGGLLRRMGRGLKTGLKGGWRGGRALISGARAVGSVAPSAGTVASTVGRTALSAGRFAIPLALEGAAGAASAAGSAALGVAGTVGSAALAFISSPIVLGAAATALAGYGLYKGYQFLTRNSASKLAEARMKQYGLTGDDSSSYHLIFQLEHYLNEEAVGYRDGKAYLREKRIDIDKLYNAIGIDKGDEEMVSRFQTWFANRFKPVFLTHLTALYAIDNKMKLDDVDKLKDSQKEQYINAVRFDGGPYNVDTSPIKDIPILRAGKQAVAQAYDSLKSELKLSPKKDKGGEGSKEGEQKPKTFMDKAKDFLTKPSATALLAMVPGVGTVMALSRFAYSAGYQVNRYLGGNVTALEAVRFKTYGLKEMDRARVSALRNLEDFVSKFTKVDNTHKANFNGNIEETLKAVGPDFGIPSLSDDKSGNWIYWFKQRFLPVFLHFVGRAFQSTNKINPADIEAALDDNDRYDIATKLIGTNDVWDKTESPWEKVELVTKPNVTDDNIAFLKEKAKQQTLREEKAGKPKSPPVKVVKRLDDVKADAGPSPSAAAAVAPPTQKTGEGESAKSVGVIKKDKDDPSLSAAQGKVPLADGGLVSPDDADQYMKLNPGVKLTGINPAFLKNFRMMVAEYGKKTGKVVTITSGFRSYSDQMAEYRKDPTKAAKPGNSMHEFGLALDADSRALNEMESMGLMRKYGFTRPVGQEPWHIEAAGTQVDLNKAKRDQIFASNVIEASLGRGGGGAGTISNAPKGRRDSELAMRLLGDDLSGKAKSDSDKDVVAKTLSGPAIDTKSARDIVASSPSSQPTAQIDPDKAKSQRASVSINDVSKANANYGQANVFKDTEPGQANSDKTIDSAQPQSVEDVKKLLDEVAKTTGVDSDNLKTTAAVESSLNPNAKASGTTASGLFQFLQSTWQGMMAKFAQKYRIDPNTPPTDARANAIMGAEYMKQNMSILKSVRPNPSATDLYLAHFLGPAGAVNFLKADPNAIGAEINPKAAAKNKAIFYDNSGRPRTVKEIHDLLSAKLRNTASKYGINFKDSGDSGSSATPSPTPSVTGGSPVTGGDSGPAPTAPTTTPGRATPPTQTRNPVNMRDVMGSGPMVPGQQPVPDIRQPSAQSDGFGKITQPIVNMDQTLTKSLGVQTQILTAIQALAEAVKAGGGLGAGKKPDGNGGFTKVSKDTVSEIPNSVINLVRGMT
jgi:hypothetical protein